MLPVLGSKASYQIPSSTINSVASAKAAMNSSSVLANVNSESNQVKKMSSSSPAGSKRDSSRTARKNDVIPQTGESQKVGLIGLGLLVIGIGILGCIRFI